MACNSAQPRDQIYVKRYMFLPFARNLKIYICKWKLKAVNTFGLIILKNLLQMHLKLLQKSNSETAEATGDLIGNKIADKITKVSRGSPQNTSETVESETENT